jgi:hypothetical protein
MDGKDLFEGIELQDDYVVENIGEDYFDTEPNDNEPTSVDNEKETDKKGSEVEEEDDDVLLQNANIEDFNDTEQEVAEDKPDKPVRKSQSKNSPSLTPYANLLKERDVLSTLDLEAFSKADPSEQGDLLVEAMGVELNNRLEQWVESFDPKVKKAIEYALKGVPLEEAIKAQNNINTYSAIPPEELVRDDEKMRKVILDYKISMGMTEEEALDEIEAMADLEKPAKTALNKMVALEEKKLKEKEQALLNSKLEQKKAFEDSVQKLKKYSEEVPEIFPGVKLNNTIKTKVFEQMTTPVKTKDGQVISRIQEIRDQDPIKFDFTLNYLVNITDGFKKMSALSALAKSSAIRDMEKAIETDEYKSSKNSNPDVGISKNAATISTLNNIFGIQR